MARIAGVDLPKDKRVEVGLTYIYGIGQPTSKKILRVANVDFNTRVAKSNVGSIPTVSINIEVLK